MIIGEYEEALNIIELIKTFAKLTLYHAVKSTMDSIHIVTIKNQSHPIFRGR